VVATAVGRYLRRTTEADEEPAQAAAVLDRPPGKRPERTLDQVELTASSWPCVLVFVDKWMREKDIRERPDDMVPRRLYLPDGRVVPTCVIYSPPVEGHPDFDQHLSFPSALLGGGYVCLSEVQGRERVGSVGCLVTDGDKVYALTNRHVTGEQGRELFTMVDGGEVPIGRSAGRAVGRRPYEEVYPGLPGGRRMEVALDAGLIEIEDVNRWTTQVFGLGTLGEIVDIGPESLSLELIGKPLRAYGAASGPLSGQILALHFRFRTVSGVEHVADALVGPRADSDKPTTTRPGDSGTLWVEEVDRRDPRAKPGLHPLALEWGGRLFGDGEGQAPTPYPLVTFLSNVCRALDVEVMVDWNTGHEAYWGEVGHYTIGAKACELVAPKKLRDFFLANQRNISFDLAAIADGAFHTDDQTLFYPLSDVPDRVWKKRQRGFVRPNEGPNHFADMDEPNAADHDRTLLGMFADDPKSVAPETWRDFYLALGTTPKNMGLVPFRVAQLYRVMVDALSGANPDVSRALCAAGVMAHYVGDACQPLHASRFHDGETPEDKGVHEAYETKMITSKRRELIAALAEGFKTVKPMPRVHDHREAAAALVGLMHETFKRLPPHEVIEAFRQTEGHVDPMWEALGVKTAECIVEGCRTLAMLWSSAWAQSGAKPPPSTEVDSTALRDLYMNPEFAPSMFLPAFIDANIW
jgi:hypothetical protein